MEYYKGTLSHDGSVKEFSHPSFPNTVWSDKNKQIINTVDFDVQFQFQLKDSRFEYLFGLSVKPEHIPKEHQFQCNLFNKIFFIFVVAKIAKDKRRDFLIQFFDSNICSQNVQSQCTCT